MTDLTDIRRKRLLFQSIYRGTKEADYLVGGFARAHLNGLSVGQLDRYERLLDEQDTDIVAWMTGREAAPPEFDHDVMSLLKQFASNPRSLI
jgi:antitoxin CptB